MQCLVILCVLVKISLTFLTNFVAKITSRFAGRRISFEDISETQESRLIVKCYRRFCKKLIKSAGEFGPICIFEGVYGK